jgi:hypothetical protein
LTFAELLRLGECDRRCSLRLSLSEEDDDEEEEDVDDVDDKVERSILRRFGSGDGMP